MLALAVKIYACLLAVLAVVATSPLLENNVTSASSEEEIDMNNVNLHVPYQHQENGKSFAYSSHLEPVINIEPNSMHIEAKDCLDFYEAGRRKSGVYVIRPEGFKDLFPVYCDMEKDGGGWTVIQRRGNYGFPEDFFARNWHDYRNGFGDVDLEFWLGNEKISALTLQGKYKLKIDTSDMQWKHYSFEYGTFIVDNELELYKLTIGNYTDSETYDIMAGLNDSRFSTSDRDNDRTSKTHCASVYKGGWWYSDNCGYSLLHSYRHSKEDINYFRIYIPSAVQIRYSQMKIRR